MRTTIKLSSYLIFLLFGCSTPKESVMPFVNFKYAGERLFPVSKNDAQFTFRAWVSLSTTIDRVFTISRDTDLGDLGALLEIRGRNLNKKIKDQVTYKESNIAPTSGFEQFMLKVDSLNLFNITDQKEENFQSTLHEPFALYVIEIKSHGRTNQFKFRAHIANNEKVEDKYQKIQTLIFKELPFKMYMVGE